MVRKAYPKAVLRAIRGSFSRFLAIFAIVALGVGFLAGLTATTPDMRHSVGVYYTDSRFMDLRIVSNLGLSGADLAAVRNVAGVERAAGAHTVDLEMVTDGGDTLTARLHGVPDGDWGGDDADYLNRMTLVSGRWPENPGEAVIEEQYRTYEQLNDGGTLTLAAASDDLGRTEFTVVGAVRSAYYVSAVQRGSTSVGNGRIGLIVYVCDSVFTMDCYTDIYAVVSGAAAEEGFSAAYDDAVAPVKDAVETLSETQKYIRRDALVVAAEQKLSDARTEFETQSADGKKKLDDALAALTENERKLADAKAELARGERDYQSGQTALSKARRAYSAEIAAAEKKLADGEADYQSGLAALETNRQKLTDGEQEYADGLAQLSAAQQTLAESKQQLDSALAEIESGEAQLAEGRKQYAAGAAELDDAADRLAKARQQISDGEKQLAAQLAQLAADQTAADAAIAADQSGAALSGVLDALAQRLTAAGQPVPDELTQFRAGLQRAMAANAVTPELLTQGAALYDGVMAQMIAQTRTQGEAALDGYRAQLAQGEQAYEQGERKLAASLRTLDDSAQQLADARKTWEDGSRQYQEGADAAAQSAQQLADARRTLDDGWTELRAGEQKLADARRTLDDGKTALASARADGQRQLNDAAQELRSARAKLDSGWRDYRSGAQQLADGRAEYETGLADYQKETLAAQDKLAAAQEDIDHIAAPEWYVLTRDSNPGYAFYDSDTLKVESIAKVFPVFFFAVAALVASTTMTRMVEEERGHIGTLKALGYGSGRIAVKYFFYAGVAGLSGSLFGLLVGLRLFPAVIYNAYKLMYNLPPLRAADHLFYGALSTALIMAAIFAATWGALRKPLRERAAELMRPKAPPAGKRILLERVGFVWNRMKFTHKVTARNLFRYKKRFFMTVIGIAGCTALLLTGFGLRDSISDIVLIQFGELQSYNLTVGLKHEGDQTADSRLRAVFEDQTRITDWMAVHMETCTGVTAADETELYVVVPQDDARLSDFFVFRERVGHKKVPFSQQGALLTEKAAATLGVKAGGTITLRRSDDSEAQIPVAGIIENYVYGYLYLPNEVYERAFGEPCEYTTLLCKANDPDQQTRDAISTALLSSPNALSAQFSTTVIETFSDMLQSIDYIVVVLIISAGALAFVVLYNLTNINITERQKELATIKVLGFFAPEVNAYVYRETLILSLIGTAVGLFGGIFLHAFVVRTAEVDAVMFGRTIKTMSFVWSAVMTMIFTALVSLAMSVKLRRIDMVESLKAPE